MKNSLLIIAVLIVLLSCKKTSNTTTPTTNQPNTPTALSYTVDAQGSPSGMYYGLFSIDSGFFYTPNINSSVTGISCYFFTTPQTYQSLSSYTYTYALANSVIVNGVKLGGFCPYQDTTGTLVSGPYKWVVNGKGLVPTFAFTGTTPQPIYTGFGQIPAVINQQQNLTLPLNGASGYDVFNVSIYDTLSYTKHIQYSVLNTTSSIVIPKDSLAKFTSGLGVAISTSLTKYSPQSVGGKNFLFQTKLLYQKTVTIQ